MTNFNKNYVSGSVVEEGNNMNKNDDVYQDAVYSTVLRRYCNCLSKKDGSYCQRAIRFVSLHLLDVESSDFGPLAQYVMMGESLGVSLYIYLLKCPNYHESLWHQEVLLLLIYQLTSCMYYNSQVACICTKVLFHLESGIAKGPTPARASATISGYVAVIKA